MNTNDLIAALAADLETRPAPLGRAFTFDLLAGYAATALAFFLFLGLRHNFFQSLDQPRFLFKFLFSGTIAVTGLTLAWRMARPGSRVGAARWAVWIVPALGLAACLAEMAIVPPDLWMARWYGETPMHCLTLVPLMSLGPLAGLFAALKHGAPSDPRRAGAAAAFAASGLAAFLYAMNCPDDSPFYVVSWYLLATLAVVTLGWFAGGRYLRW